MFMKVHVCVMKDLCTFTQGLGRQTISVVLSRTLEGVLLVQSSEVFTQCNKEFLGIFSTNKVL